MKKYLKAEKAKKTSKQGLFLLHFLRSGSLKHVRICPSEQHGSGPSQINNTHSYIISAAIWCFSLIFV